MSSSECYPDKAPQVNTLLDTLGHHIRREVIHYFENRTTADTAHVETLAAELHERLPETSRETLEIQLAHNHVPTLATRGWVDYDPRTRELRYHGKETAPYLLEEVQNVF